jgi:hypothetical protein
VPARTARSLGVVAWCVFCACAPATAGCARAASSSGDPQAREASGGVAAALLHGVACPADPADRGVAGGAIACARYPSALAALEDALSVDGVPLVAPAGARVPSAAKRFADELLPALAPRTSDLLLELMKPPAGCADAVAEVRRDQAPVTDQHAATAQDEYVAMGARARALGVVPDMLRPSCADMDAIQRAGDDLVDASLSTIARLARAQAARLVDRDALSDADHGKMVVLYGGMIHNDLAPPPESARWSYAPALSGQVLGRFVAVDLVVPEFVGTDDAWQKLPWYPRWRALQALQAPRPAAGEAAGSASANGARPREATLFRTARSTFVLLFPSEEAPP